jgi:predicted phage tail protein
MIFYEDVEAYLPHSYSTVKKKKRIVKTTAYQNVEASPVIKIILGLACIVASIWLLIITSQGTTVEERDGTGILVLLPLGIGMLISGIKGKINK